MPNLPFLLYEPMITKMVPIKKKRQNTMNIIIKIIIIPYAASPKLYLLLVAHSTAC